MIMEIAHITVKPGSENEFEAGVKKAAPIFKRAKGCSGMTLQRSHEKPSLYRLFVKWETIENHTKDFREFRRFPGMAQTGRPLLCLAARGRARHRSGARLLSARSRKVGTGFRKKITRKEKQ